VAVVAAPKKESNDNNEKVVENRDQVEQKQKEEQKEEKEQQRVIAVVEQKENGVHLKKEEERQPQPAALRLMDHIELDQPAPAKRPRAAGRRHRSMYTPSNHADVLSRGAGADAGVPSAAQLGAGKVRQATPSLLVGTTRNARLANNNQRGGGVASKRRGGSALMVATTGGVAKPISVDQAAAAKIRLLSGSGARSPRIRASTIGPSVRGGRPPAARRGGAGGRPMRGVGAVPMLPPKTVQPGVRYGPMSKRTPRASQPVLPPKPSTARPAATATTTTTEPIVSSEPPPPEPETVADKPPVPKRSDIEQEKEKEKARQDEPIAETQSGDDDKREEREDDDDGDADEHGNGVDLPARPSAPKPSLRKRTARRRPQGRLAEAKIAATSETAVANLAPKAVPRATAERRRRRLPARVPSVRNPLGWAEQQEKLRQAELSMQDAATGGAEATRQQHLSAGVSSSSSSSLSSAKPRASAKSNKWAKRLGRRFKGGSSSGSAGKKGADADEEAANEQREKAKSTLVYVRDQKVKLRANSMYEVANETQKELLDMLLASDLLVVRALFVSMRTSGGADIPAVGRALAHVFESNGQAMPLLQMVIEEELDTCESPDELFTRDSLASHVLSTYNEEVSVGYLRSVLRPLVQSTCYSPSSWEVDPAKVESDEQLAENVSNLSAAVQMYFAKIVASVDSYPLACRFVVYQLLSRTSLRYPEHTYAVVGAFFFVRFLCPAILNPEALGIVDEPPDASSRHALLLVARILESLGSGEPLSDANLHPLDELIVEKQDKLVAFFERLATPPPDHSDVREIIAQIEPNLTLLNTLARHIKARLEELVSYLDRNDHANAAHQLCGVLMKISF
jgi:GTPase-activator protein for Ras-like GTPase